MPLQQGYSLVVREYEEERYLGTENSDSILGTEGNQIRGAPRNVIHYSVASCSYEHALHFNLTLFFISTHRQLIFNNLKNFFERERLADCCSDRAERAAKTFCEFFSGKKKNGVWGRKEKKWGWKWAWFSTPKLTVDWVVKSNSLGFGPMKLIVFFLRLAIFASAHI